MTRPSLSARCALGGVCAVLVMAPIAQLGLMPLPLGDGLNAPPSNEDIARVAAAMLADPAPHIGKSYRPTGPELLSPKDIAGIMAKETGVGRARR